MSQISFEALSTMRPDLARGWRVLSELRPHLQSGDVINTALLRDRVDSDDAVIVALALDFMVSKGLLNQYYQLVTPSGRLIGPKFYHLDEEMPAEVEGRLGTSVDPNDCELVAVFGTL